MDHERYPHYFDDAPGDAGRFVTDLYEMLVGAFRRLAASAAPPGAVARSSER